MKSCQQAQSIFLAMHASVCVCKIVATVWFTSNVGDMVTSG